MRVLVLGGAGYIGSHTVWELASAGHQPVILDDLSRGHAQAALGAPLIEADIRSVDLAQLMREIECHAVMHFAALSQVGESVSHPDLYYRHNVVGGLRLLDAMVEAKVPYLIFSSSAAVYGEPLSVPIEEDHPKKPTNPYGATKFAFEEAMRWYGEAFGLKFMSLRYFNACGAHPEGILGEDHSPETHLIPLVIKAALQDAAVAVFGRDYPTSDGTCIRDYIHVLDLARAHILALEALAAGSGSKAYNLGLGHGYSVLQVIEAVQQIAGKKIKVCEASRRPGDPAVLVASPKLVQHELKWSARYDLNAIINHAVLWHSTHPQGFCGKGSNTGGGKSI